MGRLVTAVLVLLVRFYQVTAAALRGGNTCCRFTPTCSAYMIEALRVHGALYGLYLGIRRILRCHPFGACGPDPVPPKRERQKGDL